LSLLGRRVDEQLAEPTPADIEPIVINQWQLAISKLRISNSSWIMRALYEPISQWRQSMMNARCGFARAFCFMLHLPDDRLLKSV
jgi:hypothetical protein